MAELFDATKQNISLHLKNLFEEGELGPLATIKESLTVQIEGTREVQRPIVANPPFSYRWEPSESLADDVRFKAHGLAPKSAADYAFLLHGFYYLKEEGVMAIILPHGVLFRGGAEERIRTKLLKDGHIDTVIGLPANLFYSTGIPVCILVLKKCKKPDDVLFINAAANFEKGKRQNQLSREHIAKVIDTYQHRKEEMR
jgi:type I restriction enzyme M protein